MSRLPICLLLASLFCLPACERPAPDAAWLSRVGTLENVDLDEASGLQASQIHPGVWFAHNDDGVAELFALAADGADLGRILIEGAHNRDWEDIGRVPVGEESWLMIADTGDNFAVHPGVDLYFVREPQRDAQGRFEPSLPLAHHIHLSYPDGARDCESVAWDPASDRIYLMSKRDKPPQLYSIAREDALQQTDAILAFDSLVHRFRPPTPRDMAKFGERDGPWVSQPTGLDFNAAGTQAAVISYRSLYLFDRSEGQSWPQAFAQKPREFEGPPSHKEESVGFELSGQAVLITTEVVPAPLYRLDLNRTKAD